MPSGQRVKQQYLFRNEVVPFKLFLLEPGHVKRTIP